MADPESTNRPIVELPDTPEKTRKILARAAKGDESTLPVIWRMLHVGNSAVDMMGGNLAQQLEHSLVKEAAGENLHFREALLRKLELLRAELAGPAPSIIERLLAARAVTCWLVLHEAEVRYAQAGSMSLALADFRQRRIDRAHRRYLSALKTLALVRKMALPALQVNIAHKQMSVAG